MMKFTPNEIFAILEIVEPSKIVAILEIVDLAKLVELLEDAKRNLVRQLAKLEQESGSFYDKVFLEHLLQKANIIIRKTKEN